MLNMLVPSAPTWDKRSRHIVARFSRRATSRAKKILFTLNTIFVLAFKYLTTAHQRYTDTWWWTAGTWSPIGGPPSQSSRSRPNASSKTTIRARRHPCTGFCHGTDWKYFEELWLLRIVQQVKQKQPPDRHYSVWNKSVFCGATVTVLSTVW